jgi:hypothetical protein
MNLQNLHLSGLTIVLEPAPRGSNQPCENMDVEQENPSSRAETSTSVLLSSISKDPLGYKSTISQFIWNASKICSTCEFFTVAWDNVLQIVSCEI